MEVAKLRTTRGMPIELPCCDRKRVWLIQRGHDFDRVLIFTGVECATCHQTYSFRHEGIRSNWKRVFPIHPGHPKVVCWAIM